MLKGDENIISKYWSEKNLVKLILNLLKKYNILKNEVFNNKEKKSL